MKRSDLEQYLGKIVTITLFYGVDNSMDPQLCHVAIGAAMQSPNALFCVITGELHKAKEKQKFLFLTEDDFFIKVKNQHSKIYFESWQVKELKDGCRA